jgi:sigma-B regulation protein RsbU (phosphoserine phosphatase)
MLGEEGLEAMLLELKDTSGPALLETVVWKLCEYAGNDEFPDDISGILFEYQPDLPDT